PILGAGAVGACPLCWIGSASLLTYLGLGALIPIWRQLAFGMLFIAGIGFLLDFRSHRNIIPLILLTIGGILLYIGRYIFLSTWGAWPIWGLGGLLVLGSVIYNKQLFRKEHKVHE
ncbi:hypothetical protein HYT02_05565, partial [Candidatus Gottesmanbacteria bacterium]|nr:hypothetical protein [Candidatus Gottesmanbacteria bacterium]